MLEMAKQFAVFCVSANMCISKIKQCVLQFYNLPDDHHYSNENDKSTGRTWQLGCHWHSWFRTGNTWPTEISVTCSSCLIILESSHGRNSKPMQSAKCEHQFRLKASAISKMWASNDFTGMIISQSFSMRILFIMNIADLSSFQSPPSGANLTLKITFDAVKSNTSSGLSCTSKSAYLSQVDPCHWPSLACRQKSHRHLKCLWSSLSICLCSHSNLPWCCELLPSTIN